MVLIHIFRGYTITNLILDSNSVIFTSSIKSLMESGGLRGARRELETRCIKLVETS